MNDPKADYLIWLNNEVPELELDAGFKCTVRKSYHILFHGQRVPVIEITNLRMDSFYPEFPEFKGFMDLLEFVEAHNPRQYLYLNEVSMHLFHLCGERDYTINWSRIDGPDSRVSMWKQTNRV